MAIRIHRCLNPRLITLCQRSIQLESLNATVNQYLPSPLAEHCRVGSFSQGCLVIHTTDPIWATPLRYHLPALRDKLRNEAGWYQLRSIKLSILPSSISKTTTLTPRLGLSTKAQAIIKASSEECTYLPLKQALLQLACNASVAPNKKPQAPYENTQ